ncbi:alpha-L-fucosidase [Rhodopirellula sallentina]|uniref:alpha-L-fucosidase n=1 Tax=Rhodopirellula sallentina SM41 TaxID=1263870 RepID=M5U9T9_9BACT|nr:alpha-L-fucosidase [Rhodopirellula sallentina]EMI58180.1 coagulation factor 5/8 type domain protein [Rhodopirellula sallentina SM41]
MSVPFLFRVRWSFGSLVAAGLLVVSWFLFAPFALAQDRELAKPSEKQIRFADWEVGGFIHYGLNVYTGQEHGDGKEPPSMFNPTELDAEQWVVVAKSMGAKYCCLTARHEGGFCLWPSKTTDYTIANSPYMDGKGDIVRDFVDACRKHGLHPSLYLTASHDAHTALASRKGTIGWGEEREKAVAEALSDQSRKEVFKQVQLGQMRELLTNYGPIAFMWSDHWDATDPDGVWRAATELAAELQPEMVFMGPETWVPGNETGHVVYPMWNAVNTVDGTNYSRPAAGAKDVSVKNNYGLLETDVRRGDPFGKYWRVRECTTNSGFHYGGWFWHPDHLKKTYPRSSWEHVDLYYRTAGLGANTIINLPPDDRGLIPDDFVAAAKALGDEIRNRFSNPVAEQNDVVVGDVVELAWEQPHRINTVVTMENIANGQRVAKYTLEALVDGEWETLVPKNKLIGWSPYNPNPGYETIGHKKIDRVRPVTTNRIRFRCLDSVSGTPEIRRLAVYECDPIKRVYASAYPYLSGVDTSRESAHNGVRRDNNYIGGEIVVGGVTFQHGLLVCPVGITKRGNADFDMSEFPEATGLEATIGIEDHVKDKGTAVFLVQVNRAADASEEEWETIYTSPKMKGSDPGREIRVAFPEGTQHVRLLTTDAGDGPHSDHSVWADARFFGGLKRGIAERCRPG